MEYLWLVVVKVIFTSYFICITIFCNELVSIDIKLYKVINVF